ncbi:hypothetical protein [Nonomuraea sp. 10N515B]|uniref:hypothetical protein n=1 Tax=Nonomuraea sp. 10N515B TaxID=3457422 RepID=UPI003FCC4604
MSYLECEKKKSERDCTEGGDFTGRKCNKRGTDCTYYLSNAAANLLAAGLGAMSGIGETICSLRAASIIVIPLAAVCGVAAGIFLVGAATILAHNRGNGIWFKLDATSYYDQQLGAWIPKIKNIKVGKQ